MKGNSISRIIHHCLVRLRSNTLVHEVYPESLHKWALTHLINGTKNSNLVSESCPVGYTLIHDMTTEQNSN